MALEFLRSGKEKKSPIKKKFDTKEFMQAMKLLSIGLSLGSGLLGAAYLTSLGISALVALAFGAGVLVCLLYTSPSPRD